MRWMLERLVMVMTFAFFALAVAQGGSTATLAAGIAVIAVGALLGARYAAVVIHGREVTIGDRARQHRDSFAGIAEPRHPSTPGRRRSRAPSIGIAAA